MYTLTIENYTNTLVKSFSTKEEAVKELKDLCKRFNLKRQKGFWGNSKTGTEITTNF